MSAALLVGACADLDAPVFDRPASTGVGGAYVLPPAATGGKAAASSAGGSTSTSKSAAASAPGAAGSATGAAASVASAGAASLAGDAAGRPSNDKAAPGIAGAPAMNGVAGGGIHAGAGGDVGNTTSAGTASSSGNGGSAEGPSGGWGGGGGAGAGGAGGGGEIWLPPPCFFSDYVEGTKMLKALGIECSAAARLDGCRIEIYANSATKSHRNIVLSGSVEGAERFFVCSEELAATGVTCDLTTSLPFNGNDVVVLACHGGVIDSFGQLGVDPGDAGWGAPEGTTTDVSLSRACSTAGGDTNPNDPFDPATEWIALGTDVISGLAARCVPEPLVP